MSFPDAAKRQPLRRLIPFSFCLALASWAVSVSNLRADYTAAPPPEDNDDGENLTFYAMTAAAPFWAPPILLSDDYGTPGGFYTKPYPGKEPGHMSIGEPPNENAQRGMFTLSTEYGRDGDAGRYGGHFLFDTWMRLGVDAEANWIDAANNADFQTGDVNLLFRFAQHEQAKFRAGVGMRWLNDDWQDDYGVNLAYGVDWQPIKPVISSTTLEGGWIRDDGFFHARTSLGATISHVELLGGFDYLDIGAYQFAGPFAGLRIWY